MNADKAQIVEIGETNFNSEVMKSKRPVLVAFLASWSQPCHVIRPVLDEVSAACTGTMKVVKVNADHNPYLGMWYGVHSIPTLLCFVDGEVRAEIVGTASKEAILAKLKPIAETTLLVANLNSKRPSQTKKRRQQHDHSRRQKHERDH